MKEIPRRPQYDVHNFIHALYTFMSRNLHSSKSSNYNNVSKYLSWKGRENFYAKTLIVPIEFEKVESIGSILSFCVKFFLAHAVWRITWSLNVTVSIHVLIRCMQRIISIITLSSEKTPEWCTLFTQTYTLLAKCH